MDILDSIAHSNVATLVSEARVKISVTVIKLSAIHREDVKVCLNNFNGSQNNLFFKNLHYRKTYILYSDGSPTLPPKSTSTVIEKISVTPIITLKTSKYSIFEWLWNNFK